MMPSNRSLSTLNKDYEVDFYFFVLSLQLQKMCPLQVELLLSEYD